VTPPSALEAEREAGSATAGRLVYAIGDVHGEAELLERLLAKLIADMAGRTLERPPVVVFIGDYVDRGLKSRAVIEQVIELKRDHRLEVRALKGNHEEALIHFLQDPSFGPTWAEYGGLQTLLSYGVAPPRLKTRPEAWQSVRDAFAEALPQEHAAFLASLELMVRYGDYVFVHAGVRPGVALNQQREHDLLWIREPFLSAEGPFEGVIVHGHTPERDPFVGRCRIGIDTGAYATGVLTAVRLLAEERHILQVGAGGRGSPG
jgi:serine/threonine protein phosphatase 1